MFKQKITTLFQMFFAFCSSVNEKQRDSVVTDVSSESALGAMLPVFAFLLTPPVSLHPLRLCKSVLDDLTRCETSAQFKIAASMVLELVALHMPMHRNPFEPEHVGGQITAAPQDALRCMALLDLQFAWFRLKAKIEGTTAAPSPTCQLPKKFPGVALVPSLVGLTAAVLRRPLDGSSQHLSVAVAAKAAKLLYYLHKGEDAFIGG